MQQHRFDNLAIQKLIRVVKTVLSRLDVEAKEQGEGAVFPCAALREDLREAIKNIAPRPRLSYKEAKHIISIYAPDMLNAFSRREGYFPRGTNAAMIVNYLPLHAETYWGKNNEAANLLGLVAAEIIVRSD